MKMLAIISFLFHNYFIIIFLVSLTLKRQRQKDCHKIETNLVYIMSFQARQGEGGKNRNFFPLYV